MTNQQYLPLKTLALLRKDWRANLSWFKIQGNTMRVRKYILKCHWFIRFVNKLYDIHVQLLVKIKETFKNGIFWIVMRRRLHDFVIVNINSLEVNKTNDYAYLYFSQCIIMNLLAKYNTKLTQTTLNTSNRKLLD